MAPALERRVEKCLQTFLGQLRAHGPATHAHHVRVDVLARQARLERIVDHGGANPGEAVGRDAHPDSRAADQEPKLGAPLGDRPDHAPGKFGIVARLGAVRPQIERRIAKPIQFRGKHGLEAEAPMIGGHRDDGQRHWQ